jgi:transcriptional regulator with XRE-family HTH domain
MELNRAVADNIKRIRKSRKLSLERTAAMSGVSRSMLGQIERGEANPSVAILGKIAAALKVPAEILLENDDFESLQVVREMDTKPVRLDAGKVVLRPSFPYDDTTRQETFFLDMYISGRYEPEPSVPGCVCHLTVMAGAPAVTAEGESFRLVERDALRFAADRPYKFENMTNSTARLLLVYQYLK